MFSGRKMLFLTGMLLGSLFLSSCTETKLIDSAQDDYNNHYYASAYSKLYWPAINGNARAQYMMGYLTYYGLGTVRDGDVGREWIQHAAEKNYIPAVWAYRQMTNPRFEQYEPFQEHYSDPFRSPKQVDSPANKRRKSK